MFDKFPKVKAAIAAGLVYVLPHELVGIAADGEEVSIGWDCASAERYLTANPTPDLW